MIDVCAAEHMCQKVHWYVHNAKKGQKTMKKYIGCKMVSAEPALKDGKEGYKVVYPDGYESWSPKDVFEKAYLQLDDNKELHSGVSIGQKMVDEFISHCETKTIGNRTTVIRCVLRNGFVIVESSSCVDPKNYSEDMGKEICMKKIEDKIWELLGFLLQTAVCGVNN